MRNEPNTRIEKYRDNDNPIGESPSGKNWGWFKIVRTDPVLKIRNAVLRVTSSGSDKNSGWEHVSVSLAHRCPTWDEMCFVKNLFWHESETVLEFHPEQTKYINKMPYCLHLWRKIGENHELPPDMYV